MVCLRFRCEERCSNLRIERGARGIAPSWVNVAPRAPHTDKRGARFPSFYQQIENRRDAAARKRGRNDRTRHRPPSLGRTVRPRRRRPLRRRVPGPRHRAGRGLRVLLDDAAGVHRRIRGAMVGRGRYVQHHVPDHNAPVPLDVRMLQAQGSGRRARRIRSRHGGTTRSVGDGEVCSLRLQSECMITS